MQANSSVLHALCLQALDSSIITAEQRAAATGHADTWADAGQQEYSCSTPGDTTCAASEDGSSGSSTGRVSTSSGECTVVLTATARWRLHHQHGACTGQLGREGIPECLHLPNKPAKVIGPLIGHCIGTIGADFLLQPHYVSVLGRL